MMKITYEAQLWKSQPRQPKDFVYQPDQLVDHYTLNPARLDGIEHMVTCPGTPVLVAYIEKSSQIVILDTKSYAKRDKFLLKPCRDKFSKRSFTVKGVSFSPDGLRLAIGQSDCIIYLYKLFQQSASQESLLSTKPTITGKFICSSPIACLLWSEVGIIFGTQDGKIKLITTTTMKPTAAQPDNQSSIHTSTRVVSLHVAPRASMPLSLALRSRLLVISFIDCSIAAVTLTEDLIQACGDSNPDTTKRQSAPSPPTFSSFEHTCPAYHLTVLQNNTVCCAGHDGRLSMIQVTPGNKFNTLQSINLKEEVTALQYSEVNEILAVATFLRVLFVKIDQETGKWHLQASYIELQNAIAVTSLSWLKDGSKLAVACLNGNIELLRCAWDNQSVGEQLEICHIAKNRVRITDKERNLLATYKSRYDIKRVNLLDKGLSVIIWTSGSLLLARMNQPSLKSEVQWSNRERNLQFCFSHFGFVLIYNRISLQLNLIRLGEDSVIFCDKVSSASSNTISVRKYPSYLIENTMSDVCLAQSISGVNRSRQKMYLETPEISPLKTEETTTKLISIREKFAYCTEANRLIVVDLKSNGRRELQRNLERSIQRISINYTCTSLLFIDNLSELFLVNLTTVDEPKSLMKHCKFCQWLDNSDILVGQKNHIVQIWYDITELKRSLKIDTTSYNITKSPPIIDLSFANNRPSLGFPIIVKAVADESNNEFFLQLSNGSRVDLDKLKIKFHLSLNRATENRLEGLFEMLEREDPQVKEPVIWDKLGWLALDENNCDTAIRVFKKLEHHSMVKYLDEAQKNPDELECQIALLKGDWKTFESISEPEKVVSVYRKLNKWTNLIGYYERTQRFRQRDLVELEFMEWLIGRGRHFEAAEIQARNGDVCGAIEMLVENKKLDDAVDLLIKYQKIALPTSSGGLISSQQRLLELCQRLEQELMAYSKHKEAALINDKILARPCQAFELYVRAKEYPAALQLAKQKANEEAIGAARVKECQLLLAEHLLDQYRNKKLSRRLASAAVYHFRTGGEIVRALEAALELAQYKEAYEILAENKEILLERDLKGEGGGRGAAAKVAEHLLCEGFFDEAIEAYLIGGNERKAAELYMEANNYQRAYEIMLTHSNTGDEQSVRNEFAELAMERRQEGAFTEAEHIYLMLEKWSDAIEMHRFDTKNYDRMLELVEKYQPYELETNLLLLAKNLESIGDLEKAESYLLRASESEWVNVVRMYRIAGRWQEAFRVARAHCASATDPLLVQLAYWWARSYDKNQLSEAKRLLVDQLKLFRQVIEFCCENKNFQFAIELSEAEPKPEGPTKDHEALVRKFADHLESEHRFEAAEELLLRWGLVEEAARMYIDNDMLQNAIAMAERCLGSVAEQEEERRVQVVELMNKVLVRCANKLDEQTGGRQQPQLVAKKYNPDDESRLAQAQQMYLRAQRPELAVALYRKRGRWQEAIQVAQRFAPQLLDALERQLDSELTDEVLEVTSDMMINGGGSDGAEALAATTSLLEEPSSRHLAMNEIEEKVKISTRSGNQEATREALNRFLDSLVDG